MGNTVFGVRDVTSLEMRPEFKSWTKLFAFSIELIPLGKVYIQLFFLQLWQIGVFNFATVTSLGEGKLWFQIF